MDKKQKIKELEFKIRKLKEEYYKADGFSYALKIFLNSFYGIYSNVYYRHFDIRLAAAVTSQGQVCIKGPIEYLKEKIPELSVEYADTDSLFINMSKMIKKRFKDEEPSKERIRDFIKHFSSNYIGPKLKDYYEQLTTNLNSYKNTYEMDFEVIADKTIFVAKKKYVMNLVHKNGHDTEQDELKITGIEIVRTSTPQIVRDKLKELVKLVIKTNDNAECIKFIEKFRVEFNDMSFEQVAFPRGLNGLSKYSLSDKSVPISVRAAHTYNNALKDLGLKKEPKLNEGDKIKFCYVKEPNPFGQNIMACSTYLPKEINEKIEIDYVTQFEKACLAPIITIFDTLGWSTEKVNSLESFFD